MIYYDILHQPLKQDCEMLRVLQAERSYILRRLELVQHQAATEALRRRLEKIDDFVSAAVEFYIDSHSRD